MECFDYSHSLNVICTGGVDHAVRLWNPYVTAKPVAIMKGHQSSIIDLAIHEALEQVFSYDKDGVRNRKSILSLCSLTVVKWLKATRCAMRCKFWKNVTLATGIKFVAKVQSVRSCRIDF